MKKRKKKVNTNKRIIISFIFVIVLFIAALVASKLYVKIEEKIDNYNYPFEYGDIISKYSEEYNVPESVILSMIKVESSFNPDAVSKAGACGLMQLMPDTFKWLASTLGETYSEEDIFVPDINIKYGTYFVATLYSKLNNWSNVYAAYNAGLTRVLGWLDNPQYSKEGVLVNIPYEETRNHVNKLENARAKYIEIYELGE